MSKKRVLLVHPQVAGRGGGNGVAAWALQALRDDFELTLATMAPVDYEDVNRAWGTSLHPGDFQVFLPPPRYARFQHYFPFPGALLELCLMMRFAQEVDRERHFEVLLSTHNEMDFQRRGIQYVHHPWVYLPRPMHEMRWFHHIPGLLTSYRLMCQHVARSSNEGLRRNLSLANSSFIAGRIRAVHNMDSVIVFPPVPGEFPDCPWDKRRRAFVAVGRLNQCKRWGMAVAVIDEVRRKHDVGLTLIGHSDDPAVEQQMKALAKDRPWFRVLMNVSREELAHEVSSHRYGIHTMEGEHFGMAPAEMVRAGCLLFAHNSGGPIEIVGGESRLLFDDVAQGAERISRVLEDQALESQLRAALVQRAGLFSAEIFCQSLHDIVANSTA